MELLDWRCFDGLAGAAVHEVGFELSLQMERTIEERPIEGLQIAVIAEQMVGQASSVQP